MSHVISTLCAPLQMSPTAKAVLMALADNANDDGVCWPSVKNLQVRTCLSERAVRNALRYLEDENVLSTTERRNTSSVYLITPQFFGGPRQELLPGFDTPKRGGAPRAPLHDVPHPPARRAPPPCTTCPPGGHHVPPEPSLNHQGTVKEPSGARGTRIPAGWALTNDLRLQAIACGVPERAVDQEAQQFLDHYTAATGKGSTALDWPAKWRTWCRNAVKWTYSKPSGKGARAGGQARHSGFDERDYTRGANADGSL